MDFSQYFSKDYTGAAFAMFGPAHLGTLLLIVLLNLGLSRLKNAPESTRHRIRLVMALILWVNEASIHLWMLYYGKWTIQEWLPLHMCSVLIWLSGFMLIFKVYRIYEFAYFLGIAGAMQALLTPDVGIYGYPHFRYFQTFIAHGLLVTAAIYMTTVEGFRPTWKSLGRIALWGNVYMVIIFLLNQLIGSNYMFLAHKLSTPSLLDVLPPWPYYIAFIELLALAMCLLLYIPFIIIDWRNGQKAYN